MPVLHRRKFLKVAGAGGAGAAAAGLAAPAIAQGAPELKWRLTSSFPKSLDTIHGAIEIFVRSVTEATDNKFQIRVFPADEIVPALEAANAVSAGTVEMCYTASYYYWNIDPAFAFGASVPFGLNSRMQNAWMYEGGGIDLMNAFYAKHQIFGLPAGNTGAQMGGWYRKEINTPDDWKGLRVRIAGFAGAVITRLGGVAQQMAVSDVYPALEKGMLDACEWVGPHDDEKLGFHKVAKYYYYPGWWEGGTTLHVFTNLEKWNALPKAYRAIVRASANRANEYLMARYDVANPAAVRRLQAAGTQLRAFPEPVLDACFKAATDIYAELSARNEDFKKLYDAMKVLRGDGYLWFQLSEHSFDNYMFIQQRKKVL